MSREEKINVHVAIPCEICRDPNLNSISQIVQFSKNFAKFEMPWCNQFIDEMLLIAYYIQDVVSMSEIV